MLVPNERGLDRALELGCRHIAIFGSATETFAQRNLNRSLDEQFAMFEPTVARARDAGLDVRAYVSMCFGDPWEGDGADRPGGRRRQAAASTSAPASSRLGDTIGVGTAGHVGDAARRVQRGRAAPTTCWPCTSTTPTARRWPTRYAALQHGVTTFDASAGGLGGCPYAESATGNLATEDLVWMLHGLGIDTGVDLDALVATSTWMAGVLGRPSPSRVVDALACTAEPSQPPHRSRPPGAGRRHNAPMSRRVFLHVGTPKSGTSYLQDRLALNRDAARAAGARLPARPAPATTSRPRST